MDIENLTVQIVRNVDNVSAYPDWIDDSPSAPPTIITLAQLFAPNGPRPKWIAEVQGWVNHQGRSVQNRFKWGDPSIASVEKWLIDNDLLPWSAPGFPAFVYRTSHTYGDFKPTKYGEWLEVRTGSGWNDWRAVFDHSISDHAD